MAHCTPHRVGEASATELGTQNAPGKAPVRAQRRIIKYILQKRAIRMCLNTNYKCHTKPLFYQLRSLNVFDIIDLNCLVFMYNAFHSLLPTNLLSYFKKS